MVVSVLFVEALNLTKEFLIEELRSLVSSVGNSACTSLESTVASSWLVVSWSEIAGGRRVADSECLTSSFACIVKTSTIAEGSRFVHDQLESIKADLAIEVLETLLPDVPADLGAPVGEDGLVGPCLGDECLILAIDQSTILPSEAHGVLGVVVVIDIGESFYIAIVAIVASIAAIAVIGVFGLDSSSVVGETCEEGHHNSLGVTCGVQGLLHIVAKAS